MRSLNVFGIVVIGVLVVLGTAAVGQTPPQALQQSAQALFAPLPAMADNPANPVTAAKVRLGKMLYYEPRLSLSGLVSCNSCHDLATYGVDNLPTSVGHRWQVGPRNAPTVLNAALQVSQFWDARATDVEEQAQGPILNPIEMAMPSEAFTVDRIASMPEYGDLFAAAFPGEAEPLTYANIANAIGAFERTLITPSRFDTYLRGSLDALTDQEKTGLEAFIGNGCAGCHRGPDLGGEMNARFGIAEAYWEATRQFVTITSPTMPMDVGRFAVTHDRNDMYVFKVPQLRNITRTYPYFHDGSVWSLRDAIQVMSTVQLGHTLSDQDVDAMLAFFATLEGRIPADALQVPVLPAATDTTSKPNTY